MQAAIDKGLRWCEHCGNVGWKDHRFCGDCGESYDGLERRKCTNKDCSAENVTTVWCPLCGARIVTEYLERWERGEIDEEEESQHAADALQGILRHFPHVARDLYPDRKETPEELVTAINRGFGGA